VRKRADVAKRRRLWIDHDQLSCDDQPGRLVFIDETHEHQMTRLPADVHDAASASKADAPFRQMGNTDFHRRTLRWQMS